MDTIKVLKKLVSQGYAQKTHHNDPKWNEALQQGELLIQFLTINNSLTQVKK